MAIDPTALALMQSGFTAPADMSYGQKQAMANQAQANGQSYSANPNYQAYVNQFQNEKYDPNLDYFAQRTQNVGGGQYGDIVNPAYIAQPITEGDARAAGVASQDALQQQQSFLQQLNYANGAQNQNNVFSQYQNIANGTGPNPAMDQFNQATGQNMAQQAALMGSQRGGSANAGLLARQIAQNQAGIQQNAVGQAATLGSQQQLNALGQMGGIAQNQVGNQAAASQYYNQAAQAQQAMALNALNNQNNTNVAMQSNINNGRVGLEGGQVSAGAALQGGLISGVGAALGAAAKALAHGGMVGSSQGPKSKAAQYLCAGGVLKARGGGVKGGKASVKGDSLKNDTVPAMLSPKEIVIPRSITMGKNAPKRAAEFVAKVLAQQGKKQ